MLLVHLVWLFAPFQALADDFLPRTNAKAKEAEQIFRALLSAIGDNRTPPDFRIVRGKSSSFDIALYVPKSHRVMIEEEFYDLAHSLPGSAAPQALALILGHELAHFYRNHPWAIEFGKAFAERQREPTEPPGPVAGPVSADFAERRRIEADADYFGGFYSSLAGYQPLSVAGEVFDVIYRHYHFDKTLPAYEQLQYRKAAAQEAGLRLQRLLPLFEVGVHLMLVRDYHNAARVFERIGADFPGPEMWNNAAVALSNESFRWATESGPAFVYPLELDPDTRLAAGGGRGGATAAAGERRAELLLQAKRHLEQAIRISPSYTTAILNLACVLDLSGDPQLALEKSREVLAMPSHGGSDHVRRQAHLIAGIAAAHLGNREEARHAFLAARAIGSLHAEENLAALSTPEGGSAHVSPPEKVRKRLQPEMVGGVNVADVRLADLLADSSSKVLGRWEADDEQPELRIVAAMKGTAQATLVLRGQAPKRSALIFLTAPPDALGRTGRGLMVGQSDQQVEERYGSPVAVVPTQQGTFQVYEDRYREMLVGLLVHIDGKQRVRDWIVYRIEE